MTYIVFEQNQKNWRVLNYMNTYLKTLIISLLWVLYCNLNLKAYIHISKCKVIWKSTLHDNFPIQSHTPMLKIPKNIVIYIWYQLFLLFFQ